MVLSEFESITKLAFQTSSITDFRFSANPWMYSNQFFTGSDVHKNSGSVSAFMNLSMDLESFIAVEICLASTEKNHVFLFISPFIAQLSPEIFDPRKMDSNFLEANFGHFGLSTARDDKDNENCPSSFLYLVNKRQILFEPEKMGQKPKKLSKIGGFVFSCDLG